MRTGIASLQDHQVRDLVMMHQRGMAEASPPGTSWSLDVEGLSGPEFTIFGAWNGEELIGVCAMKRLDHNHAEIKSMRTKKGHLGRGVARAILELIIETARSDGIEKLSLETGTNASFAPAIGLYTKYGFTKGEAFSDYANGPHNQCYHLDLSVQASA